MIGHHPHVVGGLNWDGTSLVAWSLGNLIFDQTIWPTFQSYVLTVDVRRGEVIRAYAEPLMIEGCKPKGLTGGLAEYVAREAAGREGGPFLLEDGAAEVDVGGAAETRQMPVVLTGNTEHGAIFEVDEGSYVSGFSGVADGARPGRDLLWVGSFEDGTVSAGGAGALWDLAGDHKGVGPKYAHGGEFGARLFRDRGDREDAIFSPLHRIPVEPGAQLSVTGMVRPGEGAEPVLQLSWYLDTRGPSAERTVVPIGAGESEGSERWTPFRADVTVPANAAAVGLFLKLAPSDYGLPVAPDFDDLRLVEWAPPGTPFGPLYDHLRVCGTGEATISEPRLPGAEEWAALEPPRALPGATAETPHVPALPDAAEERPDRRKANPYPAARGGGRRGRTRRTGPCRSVRTCRCSRRASGR